MHVGQAWAGMKTYCCVSVFTVVPSGHASYLNGVLRASFCTHSCNHEASVTPVRLS